MTDTIKTSPAERPGEQGPLVEYLQNTPGQDIEAPPKEAELRNPEELAKDLIEEIESGMEQEPIDPLLLFRPRSFNELLMAKGLSPETEEQVLRWTYAYYGVRTAAIEKARGYLQANPSALWVAIPTRRNPPRTLFVGGVSPDLTTDRQEIYLQPISIDKVQRIISEVKRNSTNHISYGIVLEPLGLDFQPMPSPEEAAWPSPETKEFQKKLAEVGHICQKELERYGKLNLSFFVDAYPEKVRELLYAYLARQYLGENYNKIIDEEVDQLNHAAKGSAEGALEITLPTLNGWVELILSKNESADSYFRLRFPILQTLKMIAPLNREADLSRPAERPTAP